ncbi:hypothetical protein [Klebsiella pneumoniae]|uniref:hypothetical protein n=1 Tax=Klebsiella pneumoniae TaxID=573 RepID=UPI0024126AFD|nr:hypothetical protein [Klebsiella pneumoniae]MDG3528702.1 hypothetical protein [Klebsiella pneumoniae]HEE3606008.1 hypothetical protein [Klebsiella pneumoniae]HEE4449985.1 hypothetical protein [Klebsiella pneumoniae]
MTTDITELALITKIKKQLENFDTVILKDDEALALVETLEKAQQVDEELCRLLPPGAEYMDPPDGGDVTPLEGVHRMVADYRQRIAELESRTVKLPKKNIGWDRDEEDCWNNAIDACAEVLAAAGIKVEAE